MDRLVICDHDLYQYLLGPEVGADLRRLGDCLPRAMAAPYRDELQWLLAFHQRDPGAPAAGNLVQDLYAAMPVDLAERMHGAVLVYRAFGSLALPCLLPLANRLLQAEMALFTHLKGSGKPYRDHLGHQTRVAALAHLLLVGRGSFPELDRVWPRPLRLEEILRRQWRNTPEFHLLRLFALRRGLFLPDPELDQDKWTSIVGAAAVLAGLVHDIGYVHKAVCELSGPVAATFPQFHYLPHSEADLDRVLAGTPLEGLYRLTVVESGRSQPHERVSAYLHRHHGGLHSLVGAAWLASLESALEATLAPLSAADPEAYAHVLLSLHLGSLLAYAHDLALTDGERAAELGLHGGAGGGADVLNVRDFPLCTLFALVDVCQEFGRLLRAVDGTSLRFLVPLVGLGLRGTPPPDGDAAVLEHMWGIRPMPHDRLLLSFASRDATGTLLPEHLRRLRATTNWREDKVGSKVSEWLGRAGLDAHVGLDGEPGALERLTRRARELATWRAQPGSERDRPMLDRAARALSRHLGLPGRRGDRIFPALVAALEGWDDASSPRPFPFLPLFDMGEDGIVRPPFAVDWLRRRIPT